MRKQSPRSPCLLTPSQKDTARVSEGYAKVETGHVAGLPWAVAPAEHHAPHKQEHPASGIARGAPLGSLAETTTVVSASSPACKLASRPISS